MIDRRRVVAASAASVALASTAAAAASAASPGAPNALQAPQARKVPKSITQHGRTRSDEFQWMKDDNWQQVLRNPAALRSDIREHLLSENAYADSLMSDTRALQEQIFEEIKGRIKDDDASVPTPDGPFAYYSRYNKGAQHPVFARSARDGGKEEVLLDVDALARGKAFYEVDVAIHSPDHTLLAYAEDDKGADQFRILVKDLATGKLLGQPIENASGSLVFSPDSQFLFWVLLDDKRRPVKVLRRPARGGADVLVYEEKDPRMFLGVGRSASRNFIMIRVGNRESNEHHFIPANDPTAAPQLFAARAPALLYEPVDFDGAWYIRTNADGAVDFKVMRATRNGTDRSQWQEFIGHQPGRFVEGLTALKQHLIRLERVNALPRIAIRDRGGVEHLIEQSEAAYALAFSSGFEFDTTVMRYVYQSPTTPSQWIDYDIATKKRTLRKTQEVPSGHDPSRYVAERFFIRAKDGAEVPVTTLRLRTIQKNSGAPLMLFGYGAYGAGMPASFSVTRLSLVDRGWVWAIAHVRGGNEKGRAWFEDGRKKKKANTFTDFLAVAEGLVARGDAQRGRIVSYGGSAGGLLVGAVANMAPDGLFGGHIAAVPFVDALNTMSDPTLPLTPPEWPEWGNPIESAEDYDTIWAYSPYDQVAAKAYPPVFAHGGLTDSRVTYWEPTKWIARLRDRAPNAGPYLLNINLEAGHGGASGRFNQFKELARDFAFALKVMGDKAAGAPLRA